MSAERQTFAQYSAKDLSHSRAVEHKGWIDPQTPEGKAKIVRALVALKNNADGGALVIDVDDKTRKLSVLQGNVGMSEPNGEDLTDLKAATSLVP